jgi:xanthine dehydrogenase small subunit
MLLSCPLEVAVRDRVQFTCNGTPVDVPVAAGETLLSVLRERLGVVSVKDGCAPQGQCGCCTVLVDGDPRVACVTPVERIAGRNVTTVEGLDPFLSARLVASFTRTGGSQCGFCTPGIVVRAASLLARGRHTRGDLDRALAAHLCRCTGWLSVYEAIAGALDETGPAFPGARPAAAARAGLEGGVAQAVGSQVPLGAAGFADDLAPREALVAVPLPPGSTAASVDAAGLRWVVGESLFEARELAGKVQGRRTTVEATSPLPLPPLPARGVRLATGWTEPAYLEPDASWCAPGGAPASPLANGGAFGGKETSPVAGAARALADRLGRTVRVVLSREDVVRLGHKRPPVAAAATYEDGLVAITGSVAGEIEAFERAITWPYRVDEGGRWTSATVAGPPTGSRLRAVGLAERTVLVEGALTEAGADRRDLARDERVAGVLLDACSTTWDGALAGAAVELGADGAVARVRVRVAAGDPLDEIVLRSYAIGATHMALGWVLTEGLAVDASTGEVHDLTIRSFGIIRAKDTPPIDVEVLDDPGPPRARASDAVFSAVAAAAWNAVTAAEGARPEAFPALGTRASRRLRR